MTKYKVRAGTLGFNSDPENPANPATHVIAQKGDIVEIPDFYISKDGKGGIIVGGQFGHVDPIGDEPVMVIKPSPRPRGRPRKAPKPTPMSTEPEIELPPESTNVAVAKV